MRLEVWFFSDFLERKIKVWSNEVKKDLRPVRAGNFQVIDDSKGEMSVECREQITPERKKEQVVTSQNQQEPATFPKFVCQVRWAAWLHSKEGCRVPEKRFLQSKQADIRWPERSQMDSSCLVYTADISSSSNRETSFLSHYALFS